ncbi:FtsJ-like methyltransferase-domain-containing protein [Cokeromyces recurvatus]|uniref:FtsJ-like methyltransferase-domain-containing protein n=1 Tax=Cokeromyces recurvatus TaxID=90255 RepID=UPI00221FE8C6|nr:FtsJ-like methyltransferase-domain-containing protein [Cokeromyces recurvatus]KAI7903283.1 FtsJ-like methyltransferase-domain-containing protein [Cokeromyces recurvatus]
MVDNLFNDNDPDYRATRVRSGIPPPSMRDIRHSSTVRKDMNLSSYNPAMQRYPPRYSPYGQQYEQRHQESQSQSHHLNNVHESHNSQHHQSLVTPPPPPPPRRLPPKPKPIDFRTSTDFLKCENRISLDDLINALREPTHIITDHEFLSSTPVVERVNELREKMRNIPISQFCTARTKANPFERIGTAHFMNRAATKLAALDALFALTTTKNNNSVFRFVDICGGPGGFSEYLLWRVQSWGGQGEGYGITLPTRDEMNWHTEKFCVPHDSLVTVDGDICQEEDRNKFERIVGDNLVDLAVADGGLDFSGREDKQEELMQRLILCELLVALSCLRKGGLFVCKCFDMVSQGTGALCEICITKPLSSRPANAERYVVCKGLLYERPRALIDKLNKMVHQKDFKGVIPQNVFENDENFIDYIKMRNMKFAMKQTEALELIEQYIENPDMPPLYDQEQVKRHCLNEWRLPYQ